LGLAYLAIFVPVAMGYLYLDASLTSQSWYYISRYLANGQYSVPPAAGSRGNEYGPMSLISQDLSATPANGAFPFFIPAPGKPPNPYLIQVSVGLAPLIVL
jgi:hypothetical protein